MNPRLRWSLCAAALAASACYKAPTAPKSGSSGSSGTHASSSSGSSGSHGSSGSTASGSTASGASSGSVAGSGASGTAGTATTGTSGVTGSNATSGTTGTTGTTGVTGTAGTAGTTAGTTTATGSTGAVATAGSTGGTTTATVGTTGATAGSTGGTAAAASTGTTGAASTGGTAAAGTTGGTGATGTTGGTTGSSGSTGATNPPAGDTCADTTTALNPGDTVSGDTTNAANDYASPGNNPCFTQSSAQGPDVVYTFTPATAGDYRVVLTPTSTWDPVLYVAPLNVCTGSGLTACTANADQGGGGQPETLTFTAQANVTYGVFVDGFQSNDQGPFTLSVQVPPQPACNTPIALALANPGDAVNTSGDTSAQANNTQGSCGGNASPDQVYSFTPAADGNLQVTVAATGAAFRPAVYVQTTCASTQSELACTSAQQAGGSTTLNLAVSAGTTYYLWVDGRQGTSGAYNLSATLTAPLLGENCAALTQGANTSELPLTAASGGALVGTTQVNLTDYSNDSQASGGNGCIQGQGQGADRVYRLTLPAAASSLTATLTGEGLLYLRAGPTCADAATDLACNFSFNGPSITTGPLAQGTYYLWVDDRGGGTAQGTLTVTVQP